MQKYDDRLYLLHKSDIREVCRLHKKDVDKIVRFMRLGRLHLIEGDKDAPVLKRTL